MFSFILGLIVGSSSNSNEKMSWKDLKILAKRRIRIDNASPLQFLWYTLQLPLYFAFVLLGSLYITKYLFDPSHPAQQFASHMLNRIF